MHKKLLSVIISIVLGFITSTWVAPPCYAENPAKEYFIISTGSLGGNYYEAGKVIAGILNESLPEHHAFKVITSNGSNENVERLKNRFSDFAIVQRDVFISNYYGDGGKIKNVSIIFPLFKEKFIIYTHEKSHTSFDEFKAHINSASTVIKIGITSLDGTTYKTFSQIASLLGLKNKNIEFIVENYDELSRKYLSNEIDYVLTFSLPIEAIRDASNIYFSDSDIHLLASRMRSLSIATLGETKHKTLGVWALFIGLNSSIKQIGEHVILERIMSSKLEGNSIGKDIHNTFNEYKSSSILFDTYLEELPVVTSFQKFINRYARSTSLPFILAFSFIIIITLLWGGWFRLYEQARRKYLRIRYKHIFIGLVLVFFFYLACVEWLILSEKKFFQVNGIKSSILDMTRIDLHLWNLVRIFGNNDGGVFPISVTGKLATTLSTYIIWIGGVSIAFVEYIMSKIIAKRREGLMKIKDVGHVIIAGWSDNTEKLIEDLLFACKEYHRKTLKIVCVVPEPKLILEKDDYISGLENRKELVLVKGYIRNKNILEQCNAHQARTIILLAEGTGSRADEKTLMRALSIRKFCGEKEDGLLKCSEKIDSGNLSSLNNSGLFSAKKEVNPVYIIAEINSEEFVDDLRNAGVNGIINRSKIVDSLLVQSLLNPGVSKLINNIMTFSDDTNEFYTIDLLDSANSHLRNRTFDELLLPLRKKNILLLAIKVIYRDYSGKEIVDECEVLRLLKEEGLHRQIITNPITEAEINRKVDDDDQLITLAVSADDLNVGLKDIIFEEA